MATNPSGRTWLAVVVLVGFGLAGCELALGTSSLSDRSPADSGTQDATTSAEGGAGPESGAEGSVDDRASPGGDGGGDAGTPDGAVQQHDAESLGDGAVADTGACSVATVPDSVAGVFVASGGSDAGGCGTPTTPCSTIGAALTVLAQSLGSKTTVYVANGTYDELLVLPAGTTVQGGWQNAGGTWTHECPTADAGVIGDVVVQAPAGSSRAVTASYNGSSTLDTLTIRGPASVAPSTSIYGIVATGSTTMLTLVNVAIDVSDAGAGDSGAPGTSSPDAAAPAASTSTDYGTCAAGDGGAGSNGGPGPAASAGTFGASGYVAASGSAAVAGGPGQNGTAGGQGYTSEDSTPGSCINTTDECTGGGTMGCYCAYTYNYCADDGYSGCGAQGAGAAGGGAGGGSAIGLYVWDANVTIENIALVVGNGGNGGNGGPAGSPGAGSAGSSAGTGGVNSIYMNCTTSTTMYCQPSLGCELVVAYQGAAGGKGGNGGTSGLGGGGAGGDSYCYYTGGSGTVTTAGGSCTPGSPGVGGNQGQSNEGASGASGVHN
jgi:hypothetical protein